MGLGKKTADSAVAATAKKVAEVAEVVKGEDVAEVAAPVEVAEVVKGEDVAEVAAPVEEKAVAVKKQAAPPAVKNAFVGVALSGFKNAIPALDFGTLPRFKASPAGIKGDEGSLGQWCEATIVSYNDQFAVAPNEDGAPKELCKFSGDGVNLSDGSGTVADHLAMLKEEGYGKAACKRYNDLIVILDDAEKEHDEIGNMVTFSLSPMSVKAFERYQLQTTVKIGMRTMTEEAAQKIRITAKDKSFSGKDFKCFDFSTVVVK